MIIALIVITGLTGYVVFHTNIVALVLSLPGSNEDFVFTGDAQEGKVAESAHSWPIPPKEQRTVPAGDSPRPVT